MNINTKNQNRFNWLVTAALLLIAAYFLLGLTACGFETVGTGHRGIKTRFGEVIGPALPEGLYFYNPITTSIHEYSVRQETWTDKTEIFTKDTQRVLVEFAITFYPEPAAVPELYKSFGSERDLVTKVVKPTVLGSIKDSIGQVIADELVQKRETVSKAALDATRENLSGHNRSVVVTDLQFTNLDFDDAYERAVEEKVVAIQNANTAKNKTVQVQEQAKQTILTAEAEAQAMKIKSAALAQNKGLVQFEAVRKWDGRLPSFMMGNSSTPILDLRALTTEVR